MFAFSEQRTKLLISSNKSPETPKDLIVNLKPVNQILSNVVHIYKNTTARISFGGSQSKFEKVPWFIDRSWFRQESNGRKPNWLGLSSSFSSMYIKREVNINLSKIFPNIGKSETVW